ncbi:MAG TPA: DUF6351 family protein [Solirubrobacteraceae bacterium]|nr:DUF6351 family protein [Solirubrobacteraceae bacterium]
MRGRGLSSFPAAVSVAAVLILGASVFAAATSAKTKARRIGPRHLVRIMTLSTRADLVSGGEALTQIILPPGAKASKVKVTLGKATVTREFAVRANGKFEGLVTGLRDGTNVLKAVMPDGYGARLTITNHPIGGPVFSGPQIQPWLCQSGATDKQCDQAPTYAYYYVPAGQSSVGSNGAGQGDVNAFQSYDPSNPPPASAIATTTTTDGVTVPFIIRQETGYMDRDQYTIATLWQPGKPWQPWAPQSQYNGRLVITHGASCDTTYGTGTAPDVQDQKVLGAGFIVMSTALDNAGHNCNLLTEAESLEMGKEWVVDHYGEIKWTIGSGCSGGSLVQQQVANAYPGIYQGITPQCSFTDAWSSSMEYEDYYMLLNYFETKDQQDLWGPTQIDAVIQHPNPANPLTFTTAIPNSGKADRDCPDVPASDVWSPSNPHGVRCTLEDYMVNMFGRDPSTGYANVPFSNVGIQYGLSALEAGQITPQQFADLNAHLGGLDTNGDLSPTRQSGQTIAFDRVYRDGGVDTASNLNQVAIIDLRGPDEGSFHDVYRTYALRDRLLQDFGTAANQVLWQGPTPLIGDASFADDAIFAMDGWLSKVYADHRSVPLSEKIIQDKPSTLTDRCTDGNGNDISQSVCQNVVQAYGTPRFGAGEPHTDDVLDCQLQPLNRASYLPVTFTDAQWQELEQAFPTGVCDYSKPGVGQGPTTPWMTYQDQHGNVIYGGRPMGPAPKSVPFGPRVRSAKAHRKRRRRRAVKPAFTG